ncbi:MAG: AMP-binding protein [Pseudomonas sp.]|uniref:AMP-binding protein n=1 Tax=Pseudomonas sp. TaxID=306 RepID=UPI00398248C2
MTKQCWTPLQGLYDWERRQPGAVYMTQPINGQVIEYTWAQVGDQVRRIATYLNSLQLPAGSHIALLSKNCAHWIMADLAIWMAGHVSVPIYPSLNSETVRYILEHSEARLLFLGPLDDWAQMRSGVADDLSLVTLPGAPEVRACSWDDLVAACQPLQEKVERAADELATLIYTSGSTGEPKGVMTSFAAMAAGAQLLGAVEVNTRDRMLSYLPLSHVFEGAIVLAGSLRFGFHLYFSEGLSTFMDDLRRARPTLFLSVPRLWIKFQQGVQQQFPPRKMARLLSVPLLGYWVRRKVLRQLGLDHVRVAGSGSAPLPATVLRWYRNLGLELLEGYGMSENFSYSHTSRAGRSRLGYVGHPLPGVEHRIAEGEEIQIRSPGMFLGYFKDSLKTTEAFTTDGWFRTGDMGEIDEDGRLKITGRLKELFKSSKGKYVVPAPIENKLLNHPLIEAVCVSGANQPQPIALLMLNAEAQKMLLQEAANATLEVELRALLDGVNATLDGHEQLAFVVVVREQWTIANGFLTPTLKVKRHVLEQRYDPLIEQWMRAKSPVVWE